MKKITNSIIASFTLLLFFVNYSYSQVTLTLQPGANGKNAPIGSGIPTNASSSPDFFSATWTCSGSLCVDRGLIQFDLSSIPVGSTVVSARFSVFADSTSGLGNPGTPTYGSQNAGWLKRITSAWDKSTVTWTNQPTTTDTDEVALAKSTSTSQDYLNIDVTQLIQDMLVKGNNGFMLTQQDEVDYYNSLIFCSGNYSDSTRHPKLVITYLLPSACYAYFTTASKKDSVYFTNLSSTHLASATWNFGDGSTSGNLYTNTTFAHHYPTANNYTVCLTTVDSTGTCMDTFCSTIHACDIHSSFTSSSSVNTVTFTSSSTGATKLLWTFGDGSTDNSNRTTVTHTYVLTGLYHIKLEVWGDSLSPQCYDSSSIQLQVNSSQSVLILQPGINGKNEPIGTGIASNAGNEIDFFSATWTCGGSLCVDRGLLQFDFSALPPGSVLTSATLSLYADKTSGLGFPGSPTYGSNNAGWLKRVTSAWDKSTVTWINQPTTTIVNEVALSQSTSATQDYLNINVLQLVQDMIQNGNNGFMLSQQDEIDYYNSLIFCSSYYPDSTKHPKLVITYIPPSPCSAYFSTTSKGDSVYFNNLSSTHIASATWNFGDSTSSTNLYTNSTFAHHYQAAGDYVVCLMTVDSTGTCMDTFCKTVHSCDIHAAFTYNVAKENEVTFTSTSTSANNLYWNFGDGSSSQGATTTHFYALPGQYRVTLQVLGDTSAKCFDSTSVNLIITIPTPDTLSGVVFDDINGNGVQDAGENGITGASVTLGDNSTVYFHDTTDATGHYKFVVGNGTWKISASYPYPWLQSFPVSPSFYTVSDTIGQSIPSFSFGFYSNQATIAGIVFYDNNNNGVQDSGEVGVPHQPVHIDGRNYYTDLSGNYAITLPLGTYILTYTPTLSGYVVSASGSGADTVTASIGGQVYAGNNFGIWADPNLKNLTVDVSSYFPPLKGYSAKYLISYANIGNNTENATVNMDFDSSLIYNTSTPSETSIDNVNHIVSWDLGNLAPGASGSIFVSFDVPQTLALGTPIKTIVDIQPIAGDYFPDNNIDSLYQTVVGSFDPNEKEVSPPDGGVSNQQKLQYTIHFQNTGTYAAVNIIVTDTLSPNLDWTTFQMLSASAPYSLQLSDAGVVTWTFTNIMLPDSGTNQAGSNGFVKFEIYPKKTLSPGETMSNFADIYFDFNSPVKTNTTNSIIEVATGLPKSNPETSLNVAVYPNPMNDFTNLLVTGPLNQDYEVSVTNVLGQQVMWLPGKTGHNLRINKDNLVAGMYIYKVKMNGETVGEGKLAIQ